MSIASSISAVPAPVTSKPSLVPTRTPNRAALALRDRLDPYLFQVLSNIQSLDKVSSLDLMQMTGISKARAKNLIAQLQRRGFVKLDRSCRGSRRVLHLPWKEFSAKLLAAGVSVIDP